MGDFPDECIDAIYIDPPFFTSKNYEIIWGDEQEKRMFTDVWRIGIQTYKQFMRKRIRHMWRVLKPNGSFYLHCDHHANAHLRIMCDEIFGKNNFQNMITWQRTNVKATASKKYNEISDYILFYTKSDKYTFNIQYINGYNTNNRSLEDKKGNFVTQPIFAKKGGQIRCDVGGTRYFKDIDKNITLDKEHGWRWGQDKIDEFLNSGGEFYWTKNNMPRYKKYENSGVPLNTIWNDIYLHPSSKERLGYPTQKPEALLERIILTSSNEGDIVADFFCGCGTALAVAKKLNRKFIGVDFSHTACEVMAERIGYDIGKIIGMPVSMDDVRLMKPFEFQNWACRRFGGTGNPKKTADGGIDGWKDGVPIQVKQYKVGDPAVKNFVTTIQQDPEHDKGYIIAMGFTSKATEIKTWAKETLGIDIEFVNVESLLRG